MLIDNIVEKDLNPCGEVLGNLLLGNLIDFLSFLL